MIIKEVFIEGFKSYARLTKVEGWDPHFNAITGPNGSGKSNLVDAICFVLGITSWSKIRASAIQELVYKQGQAGITKASVSVVFDNTDERHKPPGHWAAMREITVTRQVVVGGRTKYLINGGNAKQGTVHDLFHSVQLNINNPHFLIMQGHVTKVLNMKPPEILGMIEEAMGTRMYEQKKKIAYRTIEKKQLKLNEIDRMLTQQIGPQRDELKEQKLLERQWSQNSRDIEVLSRFVTAYRYVRDLETLEKGEGGQQQLKDQLAECQEQTEELKSRAEEIGGEVEELVAEKLSKTEGLGKKLEELVQKLKTDIVIVSAELEGMGNTLKEEEDTLEDTTRTLEKLENDLAGKADEEKQNSVAFEQMQIDHKKLEDHIATLQSQQLGISVSDSEQNRGTLAQQLMDAERKCASVESESRTLQSKCKRIQKSIHLKRREIQKASTDHEREKASYEKKVNELERLEEELKHRDLPDEKMMNEVEMKHQQLEDSIVAQNQKANVLRRSVSRCNFNFQNPYQDFDRRRVKGLVARLIRVKDPQHALAVQTVAGGRLYNVVVDLQKTGRDLLNNKRCLQRRVTFIPLDKISCYSLPPQKLARAKELVGEGNVFLAKDLIDYEAGLEPAMKFVFGSTLVCKTSDQAKKLAFHRSVSARTVTLDGDKFDPQGVITGGSRRGGGQELITLAELSQIEQDIGRKQEILKRDGDRLRELQRKARDSESILRQFEVLKHQVDLLEKGLSQTVYAQMQKELEGFEEEFKQLEIASKEAQSEHADLTEKCARLKRSIDNFENERERQTERLELEIEEGNKQIVKSRQNLKNAEQVAEKIQLEREQMQEEFDSLVQQKTACEAQIEEYRKEIAARTEKLSASRRIAAEKTEKYEAFKKEMLKCDKTIQSRQQELHECEKKAADQQVEVHKIQLDIKRAEKELATAKRRIDETFSKHDWISDQKDLFGVKDSDYDFEAKDPEEARVTLEKLKEGQESLSKRINKKLISKFDKVEQDYQDLVNKRVAVLADKDKIEKTMEELDKKKAPLLEDTCSKVRNVFDEIFSTLLPGSNADLQPPEGLTVLDGLEVRVAFGGVWKDSLSELSGGQRSLLALSLILALLRYKPAPMYILDEIDAALDVEHTQNIGITLKKHFGKSQFIVVSLKQGMFNYANTLFRTKFVDGVSTITQSARRR